MNKPLVSVLMPAYNSEIFITEAIESILDQTYENFEFIIIDDCSTDKSWKIIEKYRLIDKRIKAFRNDKNLGITRSRNKLFDLANLEANYYAIFDSDDISMPERLEKEVEFLENNPDYGVVGSHIYIIDENSRIIGKRNYETDAQKLKKRILLRSPLAQPSVMIRKAVIENIGKYDTKKYDRAKDYDLWIRISDRYKLKNINEFLIKYRLSSSQGKKTHLKETLKSTIQIQQKWLFRLKYFNLKLFFYIFIEYLMLILPEKIVLWIFKNVIYQ